MVDEARSNATFDRRESADAADESALGLATGHNPRLARANRWELVGQLAAGIAHEINTPTQYIGDNLRFLRDAFADLRPLLTACLAMLDARGRTTGNAEGAKRSGAPRKRGGHGEEGEGKGKGDGEVEKTDVDFLLDEIPAAIEQSLEGVERVSEIARSMKDFSHPDNGHKHPVDLNGVVRSSLCISRNEWKYVADVTTCLDPGLPPVPCVPGEMHQVLLNLIVNAAHAVEANRDPGGAVKGSIAVRTRHDGDWVQIDVEDNGLGIPEPIRHRVFERFFTTKEVGRGTGQGLAIARAIIVERHGGTISFDTQVGRGTVFAVRIPIHSEIPFGKGDSR